MGSTSVVLDEAGAKVAEARYYLLRRCSGQAPGEERWSSGTNPTDYRFTGQLQDAEGGIYHMGARFYDGSLGRWLSADAIVPDPSRPQSFNRYSWVFGNPLSYRDPSGHRPAGACEAGENCDPRVPPPPPPPQNPPFSDSMAGAERHLVESCDPLICSEAMFNAYTPGGWDFQAADQWSVATSQVYNAGPVSLAEAKQAAMEGRPNPATAEQMHEGLLMRPNRDWPAEDYVASYIRQWDPYYTFFSELNWNSSEHMALSNFEPRYLETLLLSHPYEVSDAYSIVLIQYRANPSAFMGKMNIWKYGSKR